MKDLDAPVLSNIRQSVPSKSVLKVISCSVIGKDSSDLNFSFQSMIFVPIYVLAISAVLSKFAT